MTNWKFGFNFFFLALVINSADVPQLISPWFCKTEMLTDSKQGCLPVHDLFFFSSIDLVVSAGLVIIRTRTALGDSEPLCLWQLGSRLLPFTFHELQEGFCTEQRGCLLKERRLKCPPHKHREDTDLELYPESLRWVKEEAIPQLSTVNNDAMLIDLCGHLAVWLISLECLYAVKAENGCFNLSLVAHFSS